MAYDWILTFSNRGSNREFESGYVYKGFFQSTQNQQINIRPIFTLLNTREKEDMIIGDEVCCSVLLCFAEENANHTNELAKTIANADTARKREKD